MWCVIIILVIDMKKVAILSLHLGFGGIEKSIVAIANLLADNYLVEIACTYKLYDKPAFSIDDRVSIKYLTEDVAPNREQFRDAVKSRNLFDIAKEGKKSVDILSLRKKTMINYIKSSDADYIISTRDIFDDWLGRYAPSNVIKIGWEHNHFHGNFKYADKIVKYASKLDYFVLVSKELRDYYTEALKNSKCKCFYIPNIIDKLPKYTSRLNKNRLISVGRLSPEKGHLDLLKIFKRINEVKPDWCLDIIGDGPERDNLVNYIEKNNLQDKVKLHGFRNKDYIDDILHNSSIFLMTSYTESFGIVLIEAMSHGVPCIAFDSAEGARELIDHGENGYLIKDRDFSKYVKKVIQLIDNPLLRETLGKNAYEEAKLYTGDQVIKLWIDIFEEKK